MAYQNFTQTGQTSTFTGETNTKAGAYIRGVKVVFDVTAVPGTDTVQPIIEWRDAVSGKWFTLLAGTASAATGTQTLTVYPGIAASANVSVNDVLPHTYRVRVAHSASGAFTYTVGVHELG